MKYTHCIETQQRDGSWSPGFFAYTQSEAKGVAREAMKRHGRKVRVVKLSGAS